jgi:hypothetical protein
MRLVINRPLFAHESYPTSTSAVSETGHANRRVVRRGARRKRLLLPDDEGDVAPPAIARRPGDAEPGGGHPLISGHGLPRFLQATALLPGDTHACGSASSARAENTGPLEYKLILTWAPHAYLAAVAEYDTARWLGFGAATIIGIRVLRRRSIDQPGPSMSSAR